MSLLSRLAEPYRVGYGIRKNCCIIISTGVLSDIFEGL